MSPAVTNTPTAVTLQPPSSLPVLHSCEHSDSASPGPPTHASGAQAESHPASRSPSSSHPGEPCDFADASACLPRLQRFMSATGASPVAPVLSPHSTPPHDDVGDGGINTIQDGLRPEKIRDIFRLIQCPQCGKPLRSPVTLPCGRSLCRSCLPGTHRRANISYPGTAGRLEGFVCPFGECLRDHALGDCAVDVTLNKAMTLIHQELEGPSSGPLAPDIAVVVAARAQSDTTLHVVQYLDPDIPGFPSPQTHSVPTTHFLAMYTLSNMGLLGYDQAISFASALEEQFSIDIDNAVIAHVQSLVRQEMDCQICYALFYSPLTTPCGHTFCRHCLCRVLDHTHHCPICRRALSARLLVDRRSFPANKVLDKIARTFWSEALDLRRIAVLAEERNEDGRLPVFICTLSFPCMPTFLHVFEARYRLMVRRVLEGNKTFGMVLHRLPGTSGAAEFEELGTVMRIINVEFLPDGRSLLETIGMSRFRILSHSHVDGYVVAETEPINDIGIAEEEEREALETQRVRGEQHFVETDGQRAATSPPPLTGRRRPRSNMDMDALATQELMDFARQFVIRMRGLSVDWLASRMMALYGERPDDPAIFPWWFASILPLSDQEKYRLLGTTSVRERLKICCQWILHLETRRWSLPDCTIL